MSVEDKRKGNEKNVNKKKHDSQKDNDDRVSPFFGLSNTVWIAGVIVILCIFFIIWVFSGRNV